MRFEKWGLILMRTIYLWSLSLLLLCYSAVSNASTLTYWSSDVLSGQRYVGALEACQASHGFPYSYFAGAVAPYDILNCYGSYESNGGGVLIAIVRKATLSCPNGHAGTSCNTTQPTCEHGVFDPVANTCPPPPVDQCASRAGSPTGWKKTWSSFDSYNSDPGKPKCTTSQGGCAVDICGANGTSQCGTDGLTGEYACFGNGTYTGTSQDASQGGDVDGCEGAACQPPPPVTSSSQQSCTPNVNGSFTCVKNDISSQFSGSQCTVGSVGGSTGYVCVKPGYVPQSHDKTTQDVVTQTTNPDGSKTTVTETTTNYTTCKAGACTTTATTTTTTNGTNPDGSPGDSSTVCTGDKCDNPATDKDESKEEEAEEEVERTASGGDCSASLSCEGDAIDCAVLEQQKLMRCSMDWETQKGAVIAEAGKAEYQLETDEIDVGDLFSGPSAARWLTASCPADRSIYLSLTGSSITFSWQFICDYASGLGNLLVALASLFFAVYVGRAFGGS